MKKLMTILATVMVLACSCKGGEDTDPVSDKPLAPTGLKLHASTETSLTFQWDAMANATGYEWQLAKGEATIDGGTAKSRNVALDGLEKATKYVFSVASLGADGYKSAFSKLEATTEGEEENGGGNENPPVVPPVTSLAYADFIIPAHEEDGKARAFPGAEGGGMWATGGRGGAVYHVTNLNDSGDGSLRWAIGKSGARTIVFDVAGVIELNSALVIKNGDVTIAGQTAPGDGICLKNYTFRISASNVIVRFIRCRMGDEKKSEDDAIRIQEDDDKISNIVIDHCSVSWCTDECASFYGMKDFSFQWNYVTESLRNSIHGKGSHGYGGIWGGTDASYHHNLLAHHDSRNPRIDHDYVSTQKGPLSIVNNVIYNWSGNTCYGGESKAGAAYRKYNIVNNYYKPGPASKSSKKIWFLDPTVKCSNCEKSDPTSVTPGHFYMTGNYMDGYSAMTADNWTGTTAKEELIPSIKADSPFNYSANPTPISLQAADKAYAAVVDYAGASLNRDSIDKRIARETKNGNYTYTGSNGSANGLIDTQSDVGGWPEYSATDEQKALIADTDRDGLPDWFEEAAGLDKNSNADGTAKTLDAKGRYTNLEMYLHYLVREIVAAQTEGGTYTIL